LFSLGRLRRGRAEKPKKLAIIVLTTTRGGNERGWNKKAKLALRAFRGTLGEGKGEKIVVIPRKVEKRGTLGTRTGAYFSFKSDLH